MQFVHGLTARLLKSL